MTKNRQFLILVKKVPLVVNIFDTIKIIIVGESAILIPCKKIFLKTHL